MRRAIGGFTVLAMMASASGATCWSDAELAAARVRDLQSMLMVATLRCQAAHIDITGAYNGFVRTNRSGIEGVNLKLKAHFWSDGPVEGQRAYDRFTTRLANAYGSGDTGPESCAEAATVAQAASEAGALSVVADRISVMPTLDAERCAPATMVMAAR